MIKFIDENIMEFDKVWSRPVNNPLRLFNAEAPVEFGAKSQRIHVHMWSTSGHSEM